MSTTRDAEDATARRDVALREVLALRVEPDLREALGLRDALALRVDAEERVELLRLAVLELDAFVRLLAAATRLVPFDPAEAFFDVDVDADELFTKRTGFFARDAVVEDGFRFFDEAIL